MILPGLGMLFGSKASLKRCVLRDLVTGVVLTVLSGDEVAFADYVGGLRRDTAGPVVSAVVVHLSFLQRSPRQFLEPAHHRLPVRALVVYPVTRRAFNNESRLGVENVGRACSVTSFLETGTSGELHSRQRLNG